MTPFKLMFALLAILGLMALVPVWMYWTSPDVIGDLPITARFLISLAPPAIVLLTISSWVDPGGG
jgi:hypothetical protein